METLAETILSGWPNDKKDVDDNIRSYWDVQDQLTIQESLIFKGQQLVLPSSLRNDLMKVTHASHIGIAGCQRRTREVLYWPRMNTEFKEYMSKCDVCLAHGRAQQKEPLLQHDIPARPWAKIAIDLCTLDRRELLVVVDYYSNFIKALKGMFSRFGVPDTIVSDNGPQLASAEFTAFCKKSPHYPQTTEKLKMPEKR